MIRHKTLATNLFWQKLQSIDWINLYQRIDFDEYPSVKLIDATTVIEGYQRYLFLRYYYPQVRLVPTQEIDAILHTHIATEEQYQQECKSLFGILLLHLPGFGTRGVGDRHHWQLAFAQTKALFEYHFGSGSIGSGKPAQCESPILSLA